MEESNENKPTLFSIQVNIEYKEDNFNQKYCFNMSTADGCSDDAGMTDDTAVISVILYTTKCDTDSKTQPNIVLKLLTESESCISNHGKISQRQSGTMRWGTRGGGEKKPLVRLKSLFESCCSLKKSLATMSLLAEATEESHSNVLQPT